MDDTMVIRRPPNYAPWWEKSKLSNPTVTTNWK
jgi:hypothetical protein